MSARRCSGRRGHRGQATVEVALCLPVVILVLLAVLQVGLVARDQILVVHAAREGARAAAVDGGSATAARRAARTAPGLRSERVQVQVAGGPSAGSTVRVTVRYRSPTDVALVGLLLGDPELVATVTMRVEGRGADGP